jgi:uncharacterized membrane protein
MPDLEFSPLKLSDVQAKVLRNSFAGFGWLGLILIVYGIVAEITGEKWLPLERIAEPLSSALTIFGTVIVALSIYFFGPSATPPESMSIYVFAPFVIAISCGALIVLYRNGTLPIVVVNGFAIIGLAGALLRMQPNPYLRQISN